MNPILKYPGAKWRIAEWIIGHMPPHVGYVEPFFGSGAVFFNKPRSKVETINDIDGAVVRFFRTVREQPEELARLVAFTPWSRQEFAEADFCEDNPDDLEAARQFLARIWMTFGARTRCRTGWRHTTGSGTNPGPDNPKLWRRLPDIILQAADRLMEAQIERKPALNLIKEYSGPEMLIYADPPYPKGTRTLNGDQYRHEMTDSDHLELLRVLNGVESMVLLSGYDCEMYRDMLTGWDVSVLHTRGEKAVHRTECLWINPHAQERRGMLGWEGIRNA